MLTTVELRCICECYRRWQTTDDRRRQTPATVTSMTPYTMCRRASNKRRLSICYQERIIMSVEPRVSRALLSSQNFLSFLPFIFAIWGKIQKLLWFSYSTYFITAPRYASVVYAVVVCLSFLLAQTGTVPKRLHKGSRKQRHTSACMIYYSQKGCFQSHVASLNFGK